MSFYFGCILSILPGQADKESISKSRIWLSSSMCKMSDGWMDQHSFVIIVVAGFSEGTAITFLPNNQSILLAFVQV